MVLNRKAIVSVKKSTLIRTRGEHFCGFYQRMYFLWNLCCGFDIEALMFGIVFLHNIGRRITHKLISTKYLCFYWKAHILLSSQKIMLCMICNIDILNKDLHMFYIKKQRWFLSTRSSQLQNISHDF